LGSWKACPAYPKGGGGGAKSDLACRMGEGDGYEACRMDVGDESEACQTRTGEGDERLAPTAGDDQTQMEFRREQCWRHQGNRLTGKGCYWMEQERPERRQQVRRW